MHATPSILSLSRFEAGDTTIEYRLDQLSGLIGLRLYPTNLTATLVERREWLDDFEHNRMGSSAPRLRAAPVDSLVQVKCVGDDYPTGFAQGLSLRNSATTLALKYERQAVETAGSQRRVTTFLRDDKGRRAEHLLEWREGESVLEICTIFRNESSDRVTLEMLSSFSLGDISPFHAADAPNSLVIHRFRSAWSAEGRVESRSLEELNLERSWQDHAVCCERFGQAGSLPVKGFFPFAAVEDIEHQVCWGAQIAWLGSWQMEFYRQTDALCLSGGLADRELGHWMKTLEPGTSFSAPKATVACVTGDLDALCDRLTQAQRHAIEAHPPTESDLPIICNEFCTSWGNPTHATLEKLAQKLEGSPVRYLVIDAGWYGSPGSEWWNQQGDWNPSPERFPDGLAKTAGMIRSYGMIPGLWFEMEVAGSGSAAFAQTDHQLKRDHFPITTTRRHFWDFRDPWVNDYLADRVIKLLREGEFGYAKFDYNETIGIGVDGAESLGEGLRQHLEGVVRFFERIRNELPGLVIESCSSGGHRLEPLMIAHSAMSSFSDAHESLEVPIIAANLHRVILPRQSQIWGVLRQQDDPHRIIYSLAATFLGRMCLSGDLEKLNPAQWSLVQRAMTLYGEIAPIIKEGRSYRYGPLVRSYRHPEGWQVLLRLAGAQALVVAHSFGGKLPGKITIPFTQGYDWRLREILTPDGNSLHVASEHLEIHLAQEFTAAIAHLIRREP